MTKKYFTGVVIGFIGIPFWAVFRSAGINKIGIGYCGTYISRLSFQPDK